MARGTMGQVKREKLPVFDLMGQAFRLVLWRLPSIAVLWVCSALITLLPAGIFYFWTIDQTIAADVLTDLEDWRWGDTPLLVAGTTTMFVALILFYTMISTALIRMAALGQRLKMFNFNRFMWAGIGGQIVLGLMLITLIVLLALGLAIFAVERPDAQTMARALLITGASFFFVYFFLTIRMTLLYPDTAVTGVIRPVKSFLMTHSSFWRLLGLFFLAAALSTMVSLLDQITMPALSLLPGLEEPLWTIPDDWAFSDSAGAALLNFLLSHPGVMMALGLFITLQAFVHGFSSVLSGLIYKRMSQ